VCSTYVRNLRGSMHPQHHRVSTIQMNNTCLQDSQQVLTALCCHRVQRQQHIHQGRHLALNVGLMNQRGSNNTTPHMESPPSISYRHSNTLPGTPNTWMRWSRQQRHCRYQEDTVLARAHPIHKNYQEDTIHTLMMLVCPSCCCIFQQNTV
jgi:hypothetical protein